MKQEHQVVSLKSCINELQQQSYAQRLELQDAHQRNIESRREQARPQEEIIYERKSASRYSKTKISRDGKIKRAQELRVDEFSVQKLRESHETIRRLTSQLQGMRQQMNSMSDSQEFHEVEPESQLEIVLRSQSTSSDSKFSFHAVPRQTLAI